MLGVYVVKRRSGLDAKQRTYIKNRFCVQGLKNVYYQPTYTLISWLHTFTKFVSTINNLFKFFRKTIWGEFTNNV